MKQLLTIALLAVCSTGAFAQKDFYVGHNDASTFSMLPQIISYGNTVFFVLYNYANGFFEIYDDSFEKTKAFDAVKETIPIKTVIRAKERFEIAKKNNEHQVLIAKFKEEFADLELYVTGFLGETRTKEETDESIIYYSSSEEFYYNYNKFQYQYPKEYFKYVKAEKELYQISVSYESYWGYGDWKETTDEYTRSFEPIRISVYSLDGASISCRLTQTLFNDDEKFEYLLPIIALDEEIREEDRDGDGEIDYIDTSGKYHYTGFKVISETGETLYTIDTDKYNRVERENAIAYILNGKKYLALEWISEDYDDYTTIYSLNSSDTGIKKVMTKKGSLHVSPTIADRSQMITIELEGDSDKSHEVRIVNAAGQTVKKTFIPAGQRSVQIDAAELGHGLNVVNVNGNEGGSSKIIIK